MPILAIYDANGHVVRTHGTIREGSTLALQEGEVSYEEVEEELHENLHYKKKVGEVLEDLTVEEKYTHQYKDLEHAKSEARSKVNYEAGLERRAEMTDTYGQDTVYALKEQEAKDYLANVDRDYPMLNAEVGINYPTLNALANAIVTRADAGRSKLAQIEASRLTKLKQIDNATTLTEALE